MKKILFSPLFLVIWAIVCVLIAVSLVRSLFHISQAQVRVQNIEKQNAVLEKENIELKKKIEEVQSPLTKERIIRENLGMQKPGETIVQVARSSEASPSSSPIPNSSKTPEQSFSKHWIIRIFQQAFAGTKAWFSRE